jgi:quercetin dioxygenase-like cupin family protein
MRNVVLLAGAAVTAMAVAGSAARAQDVARTQLQMWSIPQNPAYDVNLLQATIKPGGTTGKHTHPGAELTYVASGEVVVKLEGSPDKTVKAGESLMIPPKAVHEVMATGSGPAVLVVTYVTEKGQPLSAAAQ